MRSKGAYLQKWVDVLHRAGCSQPAIGRINQCARKVQGAIARQNALKKQRQEWAERQLGLQARCEQLTVNRD